MAVVDCPDPGKPGDGEVEVRIHATNLSHTDARVVRSAEHPDGRIPFADCARVVELTWARSSSHSDPALAASGARHAISPAPPGLTERTTMTSYLFDTADTRYADTPHGELAYREIGPRTGRPIVLLHRFRGTLDHWDPAFLEVLAAQRRVITFDSAGVGYSGGRTPDTVHGMAEVALSFLDALRLEQVDLLGWSMGGFIALDLALDHPDRVNALVVAGSGPGGVPGSPGPDPRVPEHAMREHNVDEDFLFLFHPETEEARAAGIASLRRIDRRLAASGQDASPEARGAQMNAIVQWSGGHGSAWNRLGEITVPTLFANGAHDVMEPAYQTYAMVRAVPGSKALLYGDAGHGFLFQHPGDFGVEVLHFLG